MPVSQQWDDDAQTIYRVDLDDNDWTWAEFSDAVRSSYTMLGTVERTVHFIMWFKSNRLPNGNVLAHMRVAGSTQPPNIRHTVIINESGSFLERVVVTVDRVQNWEGPAILKTLEEAREYLARRIREDAERSAD